MHLKCPGSLSSMGEDTEAILSTVTVKETWAVQARQGYAGIAV